MTTRTGFMFFILMAAMLLLSGCADVSGSGNLVTEDREVSGFEKIELDGSGEIIITQGDDESLRIETDDNIMEHVKAEVKGDTLELGFKSGFGSISPTRLTFYVGVSDLTGLSVSGSGDVEADRIDTGSLETSVSGSGAVRITELISGSIEVSISGSGRVEFAGGADDQDISISGSGEFDGGGLCGRSVKVKVSGSGDATICAEESLDADISGSGSIGYYGTPSVNMSGSGSGEIESLGER